ncbi:glycosyltransferase family 2 protein [Terrimonas alba]|uniref:glycosyltransferase family 2 protein n=1 Tax=Terrimonas alba TaxID=3349636 RepID=UPI0035F34BB5
MINLKWLIAGSIFAAMPAITGISVVIPNYNGLSLLPQVLPTVLAALHQSGIASEIILADDCSTDESVALVRNNFPAVKILSNEVNSGFSVTANKGIYSAKYDWVLLLNSDVKLEPDYFRHLFKYTTRSDVFGVMGRIIGWGDEKIQDAAKFPFFHGVKIKTSGNYLLKDEAAMTSGLYSMYLSGANAFLNRKIFLDIGGFNELFSPFYVEDFELSLRAWRLGFKCYFDYNAVCRHRTSATINSSNKKKHIKIIYNRNKMYLHAIHLKKGKRVVWFVQLFLEALVHLITFKWTYIKSMTLFFKNYSSVQACRKELDQKAFNKKLLSVDEVVGSILQSIAGREIIRF